MTQNTTNGVDVRAADVFKSVTSNLNDLKLIEFTWQNNVTRLNQTNLNLLNEGINTALTSIKCLTGATSTALDTLNSELTKLKGKTDTNDSRITAIETTLNGDGENLGLVENFNAHCKIYKNNEIATSGNFSVILGPESGTPDPQFIVKNDVYIGDPNPNSDEESGSKNLYVKGSIQTPTIHLSKVGNQPVIEQDGHTINTLETLSSLSNMKIRNKYEETDIEAYTYNNEKTYSEYIPTVYFVQSALDSYFTYLNKKIEWTQSKIYIDAINTATSVISHSQEVNNSNIIVITPKRISNLNKVHIDLDLVTGNAQDTTIILTVYGTQDGNPEFQQEYTLGDTLHASRILGDIDCLDTFLKFNFNEINRGCAPIDDSPVSITCITLYTNTQVSGKCVVTEYYDLPKDTDIINMEDILDE